MTTTGADVADLLARTRCLLLDFDGPICSVFAGYPAAQITRELLDGLLTPDEPIPASLACATDPFDVLHFAASRGLDVAVEVEQALTAAEVTAIHTAAATPHAPELIAQWRQTGRPLVVVSNNSRISVQAYLAANRITVDHIVARTSPNPAQLKPSPAPIQAAIEIVADEPGSCVLVGDSMTDIQSAIAAGVHSIGYANKPGKHERLTDAGADLVVDAMATLVDAIS